MPMTTHIEAIAVVDSSKRAGAISSRRVVASAIGALFLLGFASYGPGFGLVPSVVGVPDFLATVSARQVTR